MKLDHFLIIASVTAVSLAAIAQEATTEQREAVVNQRQENQQKRIDQGVQSGELNANEAARLNKQEGRIDNAEQKAMADGKMTKGEFKKIERMQNRESRRIHHKKHNRK